jgi:hypothetical protein
VKCLSVRPPWAWALVFGGKTVENRTARTAHRGPLLIHAAKTVEVLDRWPTGDLVPFAAYERAGHVLGLVDVVGCVRFARVMVAQELRSDPWAQGPWCWRVARPRPVEPFRWRGLPGLFDVPDDLVRELLR